MVVTFLISDKFEDTAKILDKLRLGKQITECVQIINVLEGRAQLNHPAVSMWQGYTDSLKQYYNVMLKEWLSRGYKHKEKEYTIHDDVKAPEWISNKKVWYSHMSRLVDKDGEHYSELIRLIPEEYRLYGYIWPSKWTSEQLNSLTIHELGEPKPVEKKCIYKGCKFKAKYQSYCGIHGVRIPCSAVTKTNKPCRNQAKDESGLCGVHSR